MHVRLWSAAAVALLLLPQATASPSPPEQLEGTYGSTSGIVSLTWQPPDEGEADFVYHVWRDQTALGSTTGLTYADDPPGTVPDYGLVYLVSAAPPGNDDNIGLPAVVGVPTISCDVVTVTTTWDAPYLYVTLHEECLNGAIVYDKSVTWEQP